MPEPPLDTIQESMKFVGASSFEGNPIHFTANGGAPSRHGGSPSRYASDSDDSGKAVVVEGDTDMSGVTGKEPTNATSSSSSSSSTVADTEDTHNNFASGSSSEHDEAEDTMVEDMSDEDTTDEPEAPMRHRALTTLMNESDPWCNQEPRLFEDTPEQANISSGLGTHECVRLMGLPEELQHDAAPHRQVQEPEEMLMLPTSIVTFQVPGFSMGLGGGIVPFAEWQSVEDPDDVGLENLDIFVDPWRTHG